MPSEIEIAWVAGFYEGEGSIGPRSVIISQVNPWPLEKLIKLFGGHMAQCKRDRRHRCELIWQWNLCGQAGRDFIKKIYPYFSPKRQIQIDNKFLTDEKLAQNKILASIKRSETITRRNEIGQYHNA